MAWFPADTEAKIGHLKPGKREAEVYSIPMGKDKKVHRRHLLLMADRPTTKPHARLFKTRPCRA